jgi:hypothetical protein
MAKTIFNSTEKSNFILNMTEEKYSSLASKSLVIMCLIISVFSIPAECIESVGFPIVSGGLAIAGVICMILTIIAVMKKYVPKKTVFTVGAFGVMLIWGIISLINSYDVNVGFYGFDGRGEGLLAIIFYFCFFMTGLTLKREKAINTFINGIIAVGLLNSVWGILQVFIDAFPGSYSYVVTGKIMAASGLAQSPIFLAMLLTLSLTAAIIGFVTDKSKKRRIFCMVSVCIFSFVMIFTYSLAGICGLVIAVISAVVTVFVTKSPKIRLLGIIGVIIPSVIAVVLVAVGVVGETGSYKLHDGAIMWKDSYNRLSASGIYNPKSVDIDDTADVYYYLTEKTMNIIEDNPLTGTGPEQLVYPQLYSSSKIDENVGTFDKNYNEYLYTAATRGIPSLIALIVVLVTLIYISSKKLRENRNSAAYVTTGFILIAGVLIFFVGCSNIVFSPIFWAVAGAACSSVSE